MSSSGQCLRWQPSLASLGGGRMAERGVQPSALNQGCFYKNPQQCSELPWATHPELTSVRKCLLCLESHPASPGRPQVMNWEGLWSSCSSCQDTLFSHLPGKGDSQEVFELYSYLLTLLIRIGPPSLGRKYHFYPSTRKPGVALYETKITIFFHLH